MRIELVNERQNQIAKHELSDNFLSTIKIYKIKSVEKSLVVVQIYFSLDTREWSVFKYR